VFSLTDEQQQSVVARALAWRGGTVTKTDISADRTTANNANPQAGRNILADTLAVIESHEQLPEYTPGIWWEPLCEGLRALAPEYAGLTVANFANS
jgi:hypothetical protein